MVLSHSLPTLIQRPIKGSSNSEGTANDGADTNEEAGEGFGAGFTVDDFHGRDVLAEYVSCVPRVVAMGGAYI